MPSNPTRDQQIDVISRDLIKKEPYLQNLSRTNPSKALKKALTAASRILDGKPHNLPAV